MNTKVLVEQLQQELVEIQGVVAQTNNFVKKAYVIQERDYLAAIVGALALNMHGFYTGTERIFLNIAKKIDGSIPEGSEWHLQLLKQMAAEIPGIRFPVISRQTQQELDEFRRFRHVVRSHYAYKLDAELVLKLAAKLPDCSQRLTSDCLQFAHVLSRSPQEPGDDGLGDQGSAR